MIMWSKSRSNLAPRKVQVNLNRWRLVLAIVFLFSLAIIYKLFNLQIQKYDLYTVMAAGQQQISSKLKPERGKIYFTADINNKEKLYPVATNKDFAILYAIPKDVLDPKDISEKFYEFFDKPVLIEKMKDNSSSTSLVIATSTKDKIVANYEKRFDRPGDPYEPLEGKKLEIDDLLKLYAFLKNSSSSPLKANDLVLNNYQVVYKKNGALSNKVLKIPGLDFTIKKLRYYPENEIGAHVLGFVSYANSIDQGKYGLEEFFNDELSGKYGFLKAERGADKNLPIVSDREYNKPINGSDLILTIDRNVEFFACTKLKEAVKKHGADGGSVIVMDPKTGAIIAMCSVPEFDPNNYQKVKNISVFKNPIISDQYEPGSVFKTVTMSIALDRNKVKPSTTYVDKGEVMINGWPKPIKNADFFSHGPHGLVDMNTVLEYSLNTGAIFAMKQTGVKDFSAYVKKYGFGEKTGIELGAEASGNINNIIRKHVRDIDAATASFGQGISATPLQMLLPYQVIANKGILMKPYIVKEIVSNKGKDKILPEQIARVISAKTAATISAMLVNVVELGHAKHAYINGYYVGGKTGTAQVADKGGYSKNKYVHTFVGIAPIDNPAFVMLTKINDPKDVQYATGSALPLWTKIADFMLKYYQIPKTRK